MSLWPNKGLVLVLVSLALGMSPILCGASSDAKITYVRLNHDLNRLVVKGEGELGRPSISRMDRSSKLILDFERCGLGDFPRTLKLDKKLVREVRTEKTRLGVRVTVDFGGRPIPEYRFNKIDDCYMILFGDTPAEPAASPSPPQGQVVGHAARSNPPVQAASASVERTTAGVIIKRARVVDGSIVLHVAPQNRATELYRVVLGLDFRQPGFKAAVINRVSAPVRTSSPNDDFRNGPSEDPSPANVVPVPARSPADPPPQTAGRGPTRVGAYRACVPKLGKEIRPAEGLNPILAACTFLLGGSQ